MIKLKSLLNESTLQEGVYDPGILKAVFITGGPGSGKSFITKELFGFDADSHVSNLSSSGLKNVTSDRYFEDLLKKNAIPLDINKLKTEDPELYDKAMNVVRPKAANMGDSNTKILMDGRIGIVFDGSLHMETNVRRKKLVESYGYDTLCIFVNTNLEVAKQRNRQRDRKLPDEVVERLWNTAQSFKDECATIFNTFVTIDNSEVTPKGGKAVDVKIQKVVDKFLSLPVKNHIGKQWVELQLQLKNRLKQ